MAAVGRVLVQGGGVGGLTFAAAIGQRGVEVDVLEAAGTDAVLGVGLNQPANALAAVDEIGVREECLAAGFAFEDLELWTTAGDHLTALPPVRGIYPLPSNNAISRPVYNGILRSAAEKAGARVHTGVTVWDLEQDADGVDVTTATWAGKRTPPVRGSTVPDGRYDLVVGFDGVRSAIRRHLFGDRYEPTFTGSSNWRVTLPRPEWLTHSIAAFDADVKVVLTPIAADQMYFGLVTPEPGNPRFDQGDLLRLFRERTAGLSGRLAELRDLVTDDHTVVYTPLEYVTVREPWFRGRIAIGGDAVHATSPHISQGAAMAVEDAVTLGAALGEHDDVRAALAAWFERRRDRALFVADVSLALLRKETSVEWTPAEVALMEAAGTPPHARLFREAY